MTILSAAIGPALVIGCLAPLIFPCGASWQFIVMQLVVLGMTMVAYAITPARSVTGWLTLLVAWILLSWGTAANLHQWTVACGHTVTDPLLTCDDDLTARQAALEWLGIEPPSEWGCAVHQYVIVVAGLIKVFGLSIIPPLGVSMGASMLSIVVTGQLAQRVATVRTGRWRSTAAMIMIAAQAYWLTMGTLMFKESLICLGMVTALTGMTALWRASDSERHNVILVVMIAAGMLLTGLLRLPMAMMAAGASLLLMRRGNLRAVAGVIVLAVCVWVLMQSLQVTLDPEDYFDDGTVELAYFNYFNERDSQAGYMKFIGDYAHWSWLRRIMWLPVSMAVQWIIPLAWNAGADIHRAVTLAYAHQGWVWYAEGGVALAWFITSLWQLFRNRRHFTLALRLGVWLVVAWAGIGFMYGGAVSRYLLPMMPVAVTLAVQGLGEWRRNRPVRRAFLYCYLPLLAAALVAAALL